MALAATVIAATIGGDSSMTTVGSTFKAAAGTIAARGKTKTAKCKKNCTPVVTMSVSPAKVHVGETATLTWSASGATSCTGSDTWSGAQAVSGSLPVTPSKGGQYAYTLACSSGSATGYGQAVLEVPIPVLPSSYENRMAAGDPAQGRGLPTIAVNGYSPQPGYRFAWGDFFQDGSYSLVFPTLEKSAPGVATADLVGHFYFFKLKQPGFHYEDHTSEILKDTTACLGTSGQTMVADFNGDGVPDVYQECYGIDGTTDGDQDHLLLSQPDGTFANIVVPGVGARHGATAADLNGDGLPDVLEAQIWRFRVDPPTQHRVLINNGDGTFHEERQRLPASLIGKDLTQFELIDVGRGMRDLFVGGVVCGSSTAVTGCPANWLPAQLMIQNDGSGHFTDTKVTQLPNPPGATGVVYGPTLNFVYVEPNLYWNAVSQKWNDVLFYQAEIIHRLNLTTGEYQRVFEHIGGFPPPDGPVTYFYDFLPWGDGTMRPRCMLGFRDGLVGLCALSFPM